MRVSLRLNWHALVTGSQRVGAGGSLFCSLCFCLRGEFPSHSNMFFQTSSAKATELRPPRSDSPRAGMRCYDATGTSVCARPRPATPAAAPVGSRWGRGHAGFKPLPVDVSKQRRAGIRAEALQPQVAGSVCGSPRGPRRSMAAACGCDGNTHCRGLCPSLPPKAGRGLSSPAGLGQLSLEGATTRCSIPTLRVGVSPQVGNVNISPRGGCVSWL